MQLDKQVWTVWTDIIDTPVLNNQTRHTGSLIYMYERETILI